MEGKCRFSIAEIQSLFQNITVNFKKYYMSKLNYGLTDQIEKIDKWKQCEINISVGLKKVKIKEIIHIKKYNQYFDKVC